MAAAIYELQGYTIVLDKVAFITRVFQPEEQQSHQFNVRFQGDHRLSAQFASRHEAELARQLFIKALRERLDGN